MNHSVLWVVWEVLKPSWTVTGNRLSGGPPPPTTRGHTCPPRPHPSPAPPASGCSAPPCARWSHPGSPAGREEPTARWESCSRNTQTSPLVINQTSPESYDTVDGGATHQGLRGTRSGHMLTQPWEFRNHVERERAHAGKGHVASPGWSGSTHTSESSELLAVMQLIRMLGDHWDTINH